MNKFMKKICTVALASVMAGSMMACGSQKQATAKKTSDGKSVYWYNSNNANAQCNISGRRYYYIAIFN